ncbi:MAG: hypothetical protein QOI04_1840 [Verrucomicrobiota bacterium]|jgi:hypothetical protein
MSFFMTDVDEQALEWCRAFNKEHSLSWVEPPDDKQRASLERFCELVEELQDYAIFKNLLHRSQIEWNVRTENKEVVAAAIRGLDEEHLRSFLLTLRMLYHGRERCSVREIAKIFEERVGVRNPLWWNGFNAYRLGLNSFFDQTSLPNSGETNREIFETFLWGKYAHRDNPEAVARYKDWEGNRTKFVEFKGTFLLITATFFSHLQSLLPFVNELLAVKEPRP